MTLHLTEKQLEWLAKQFQDADVETKINIDSESKLEQQLFELGLLTNEDSA